jgi:hypothetical protein
MTEPVGDEPDPRLLWRWAGKAARPWIGWAFIGLGAFLVLLGYFGVSRESIVEKQIPYLVSGGIGGVLLCVVGAYFLGTEELRKDSGRLDRLESMVQQLHEALLVPRDGVPEPVGAVPTDVELVAVVGGETFHKADCVMAGGKAIEAVTSASATSSGLRPCPLCEPAPA